jgi:hypothetical protein
MPIESADALIAALDRNQLLRPEQLHEAAQGLRPHCPDAGTLADELVRRGWLTAYTADMLLGRFMSLSHAELMARLPGRSDDTPVPPGPALRRYTALRLGTFVFVALLIGLGLHLLVGLPPAWAAFWGFALYRVAWRPSDLVDRSCAGCGCAFLFVTAAATFVLNRSFGQTFDDALGRGGLAGLAAVLLYCGLIAVATTRENNRLYRRLRSIPSLPTGEAQAQVERLMSNRNVCRYLRAPTGEETPGAELGPLLREFFERYARVEFLYPSGHVPNDLRFDRRALRPSIYLVGYVQLNHFAWLSRETAFRPHEDTVYVIDAREYHGYGLGRRKREVPEVTETYPSIYHFVLARLVYSGHAPAVQVPPRPIPDAAAP